MKYMDDEDRKGLLNSLNDGNLDEKSLKDYVALKLTSIKAEHDAAIRERNKAIAEKKIAIAERDAAYEQRDAAIAQREEAIMERDAAVAALENAREERSPGWHAYKAQLAQMVGSPHLTQMGACSRDARFFQTINIHHECTYGIGSDEFPTLTAGTSELVPVLECEATPKPSTQIVVKEPKKGRKSKKRSQDVDGSILQAPNSSKGWVQGQQSEVPNGMEVGPEGKDGENNSDNGSVVSNTPMPIPYCSCTGANQLCYRWGIGGWQSACCTTMMSMYPLPMNPNKKGYRFPGRKMSAGAFQKLLLRLSSQGIDVTKPVDLKDHWAKHGTNRYVTIK
ncbi:hypothetical protein SUGI_0227300 [Cryptomeria japonica]|uniref:protein BASIC PENTACYSTEINE6 n=1 Tax=Cryptomeria japonica TaxID=3369 RepID=UPI002408EAA0|nr:protein BASIC PENTACYSTEINE6 [Cryptomeria japonica]GLJ14164.1 hypothetical protein SUGI_0227300 [Cryptomeria japonica]